MKMSPNSAVDSTAIANGIDQRRKVSGVVGASASKATSMQAIVRDVKRVSGVAGGLMVAAESVTSESMWLPESSPGNAVDGGIMRRQRGNHRVELG